MYYDETKSKLFVYCRFVIDVLAYDYPDHFYNFELQLGIRRVFITLRKPKRK